MLFFLGGLVLFFWMFLMLAFVFGQFVEEKTVEGCLVFSFVCDLCGVFLEVLFCLQNLEKFGISFDIINKIQEGEEDFADRLKRPGKGRVCIYGGLNILWCHYPSNSGINGSRSNTSWRYLFW